jgi:hypothetical protein
VLRLRDRLGRGTLLIYSVLNPKSTTSWLELILHPFVVGTSHGRLWTHLTHHGPDSGEGTTFPPYSILCVVPPHPQPNGFYSRDSQGGVPILSRFGLLELWEVTTPSSDFGLERGVKQTSSSLQKISNSGSHSFCTPRGWVDSQLFVVGSQIVSLTLGPSFDHNLCCRCPNGPCEAIFDIYTSSLFQRYKKHLKARCFDLCN